jgi:hypothetical protein
VTTPLMPAPQPITGSEAPTERLLWWLFGRSPQNLTDSDMQVDVLEWGRELQSSRTTQRAETSCLNWIRLRCKASQLNYRRRAAASKPMPLCYQMRLEQSDAPAGPETQSRNVQVCRWRVHISAYRLLLTL